MSRAIAVPAAAVLGAAMLALLSSGAFAVGDEVRTGLARSDTPAVHVAGSLVGAKTQRQLTEALRLLRARGGTVAARVQRRQRATALLTRLAARGNARAANLVGVLATQEAAADSKHAQDWLATARAAFVAAIQADPQAEDAKYNLELLLSQSRQRKHQRTTGGSTIPLRGRSSGHRPGSGY
jgi:hypothetical protein